MSTESPPLRGVAKPIQFVLGFAILSACLDVPLPAHTELADFVRISPDVLVLLGLFALFATRSRSRPPRGLLVFICAALLAIRCGLVADGICLRYLDRQFHLSSDLPLIPEFARLALSTLGLARLVLVIVLGVAAFCLLGFALWRTLHALASILAAPRFADPYLVVAGVLALIGFAPLPFASVRAQIFAAPVLPRVMNEVELLLTARGLYDDSDHAAEREVFGLIFRERQARLVKAPRTFARLHGADVHLVLLEAYGHTVFANPAYLSWLATDYREFGEALERAGFSICSDFVRATAFGGNSWLTHATLETAVPFADQFEYGLLFERGHAFSLAQAFRAAGYRALSVKPGTTRAAPHTRIYGFDREYAASDLGYRGPSYAWAPMPDQFVLQRVAERELHVKKQPLFLEYALVSTHFPFTPLPRYVSDWASLGDGSIFNRLLPLQASPSRGLSTYAVGYLLGLQYELRVLAQFITREVQGDALVLLLGDHQPIAPVADPDRSRLTPLHVLSRRSDLLEPFRARGCTPGLFSRHAQPYRTMEDLAIDLLEDLGTAP